jgi:opacity protein-like surface antigen
MLLSTVLLTAAVAAPASAQRQRLEEWQNRWYWGIKGGLMTYQLPTSGNVITPSAGADWLITHRRAALYISYSRSFQAEQDTFAVEGLAGTNNGVAFDGLQKISIGMAAMIGSGRLQPYIGGGFALNILANARSTTPNPPVQIADAIDDATSGAFLFFVGGVQYRMGQKGAIFASWQYSPLGRTYLLQGGTSTIEAGFRYAFLNAKDSGRDVRSN